MAAASRDEPYRVTHEVHLEMGESPATASTSKSPSVDTRGIVVTRVSMRAPLRSPSDWRFWCRRMLVRLHAPHNMTALNSEAAAEIEAVEEQIANRALAEMQSRQTSPADAADLADACAWGDVQAGDATQETCEQEFIRPL